MRYIKVMLSGMYVVMCACSAQNPGGEACDARDQCASGFSCLTIEQGSEVGTCLRECDLSRSTLCEDGSVCSPVDASGVQGACNVIGGPKQIGQACERNGDCVVGAVCLEDVLKNAVGHCWQVCQPDDVMSCSAYDSCKPYGADGVAICQPGVLGACDVEACLDGFACGTARADATLQEQAVFADRCTISGCIDDADCPSGSMCRDFHGTYDQAAAIFAAASPQASLGRYCYASCAEQDACGVRALHECLDMQACEKLDEGSEVCKGFVGEESLCVPTL